MKDRGLTPWDMFRLNDPRRAPATVKQDVLPFCHLQDDPSALFPTFDFPPPPPPGAPHLPRVWVSSCAGAAQLLEPRARRTGGGGPHAPPPHHPAVREITEGARRFSHVFIDEAGQALVPESLVPLMLAAPGASVLLAGDPKQLGPALHSRGEVAARLSASLLEESMAVAQREQSPRRMTQLVQNYRSHVDILSLPSRCGRGSLSCSPAVAPHAIWTRLIARPGPCGPPADAPSGSSTGTRSSPRRRRRRCPCPTGGRRSRRKAARARGCSSSGSRGSRRGSLQGPLARLFLPQNVCVRPPDQAFGPAAGTPPQLRDGDAPSWYNPLEAATVVGLLTTFLRETGLAPTETGVICTYRRQVQKVRDLLRAEGLGVVRVGTCDDYQARALG